MKSEHYDSNMKMREVIADTPVLLMALSRFNIPLGFGDETIAQVCARAAVDTNTWAIVSSPNPRGIVNRERAIRSTGVSAMTSLIFMLES